MIVDSSALIALIKREPEADAFTAALGQHNCRMSVANWVEATMVAEHLSPSSGREFDAIVADAEIELVPVTVEQAQIAREAHRRYGRGSGSPARLNFGDCFAYALARTTDEPLLYKGDDFTHTDVQSARG